MRRTLEGLLLGAAIGALAWLPAEASTPVTLDGSFDEVITRPTFTSLCPSGAVQPGHGECGVLRMVGLGAADYVYVYGPTFEPTGKKGCYTIDGTFTITLESDGSTVSGPLTGVFCGPGNSQAQVGTPSYGGPKSEHDSIAFGGGTGRFAGLHGTAAFSQSSAGARRRGTLSGVLTP
jgi:hypothetical protein